MPPIRERRYTHGKFIPPRTYEEGVRDRKRAAHEVERIDKQLADQTRPLRYPTADAYEVWAGSAKHARAMLVITIDHLDAWLAENRPWWARVLLEIALDTADEDLSKDERAAIDEARAEFEREDAMKTKARTA